MPNRLKLRGRQLVWILKNAHADGVPPAILRRAKEGFSIPMKKWLGGPLKPMLTEIAINFGYVKILSRRKRGPSVAKVRTLPARRTNCAQCQRRIVCTRSSIRW